MPSTLTIDVTAASQGERSGPRTSEGERLLLDGDGDRHSLKAEGILAYRLGSFVEAERLFSESFTQNEPDPETLIYFNNALVSQQAEFVTIAVVVSFNGETAIHTSKEILRGVAQAQREFIKTGNALKVVIGDDQLDPQIAQQLALSFAENPAILGVIGHPDSDMSLAAGDVYQQVGLVMMSATSTAISLTGIGDFIFRTIPNDLIAAQTMATYVSDELKSRKIAVFYNSQSDYSRSLYQSFLDALGPQGTVVITADMDGQAPSFDLAQFMGRMEAEGAEAIALLTNASKLSEVLEIIQINQRRLPIIAGDALYNLKILEAGAVNAEGLVVAIPWHILVNPSAIFPVSARELWQGDVSWRTALSYDATRALSKALQETPTYDRQSLQNILADPNFSATGAINKINFSPSGDRNQSILMVRVVQGNRYGLDYQFVPF
ncbi:MAG: ABC transporter substrate-binding protein [Limnothrix sp. RL_2_0]|nr:ABC transporter substrate-binding protein [Limnothrix sp. RL_2_0]